MITVCPSKLFTGNVYETIDFPIINAAATHPYQRAIAKL